MVKEWESSHDTGPEAQGFLAAAGGLRDGFLFFLGELDSLNYPVKSVPDLPSMSKDLISYESFLCLALSSPLSIIRWLILLLSC